MATLVDTATSTATDALASSPSAPPSKTTSDEAVGSSAKRIRDTKYRHVFATHSQSRMSCLTQGAPTPSFVGFRNLMILVLGAHIPCFPGRPSDRQQSSPTCD